MASSAIKITTSERKVTLVSFHRRRQGGAVDADAPHSEKKLRGAEFMGVSCKVVRAPRGRKCTPRRGGVTYLLGRGGCSV